MKFLLKVLLALTLFALVMAFLQEFWWLLLLGVVLGGIVFLAMRKRQKEAARVPTQNGHSANAYIVLDIETTGLSRKDDRIIEIAANKYQHGELTGKYHTYINPGFPVYSHITQLTGITNAMLESAPTIQQVKKDFLSFIGSCTLVGHNIISFDIPFIKEQLKTDIRNEAVDTLRMAKDVFPGLPSYKLSFLDQALHLGTLEHHRAGNDIIITNELYLACKNPKPYMKYIRDKEAISKIQIEPRRKGYSQIDIHSIVPTDPNVKPNTPLTGKCIVFSGVFTMPIETVMQIAVDAGGTLKSSVSRKVQYLVVGVHKPEFLDENGMASKQRTAMKLNAEGQADIKIIDEKSFLKLARMK